MIILHFHLQSQFKMNYFIYTSHQYPRTFELRFFRGLSTWKRNSSRLYLILILTTKPYMPLSSVFVRRRRIWYHGARGFSCVVSGFGQVFKSDLRRSCLRPSAEQVSAHRRRNDPRDAHEKKRLGRDLGFSNRSVKNVLDIFHTF